jgi:hypothetical protein
MRGAIWGVMAGCSSTVELDWDPIRAADVATLAAGWGTPELVSVSTNGWEEGVFISPDESELYWIYTNFDVFSSGASVVYNGPNQDPAESCTHWQLPTPHACGVYPRADHFWAEATGSGWSPTAPHPLTLDGPIGGLHVLEFGEDRVAYFMSGFQDEHASVEDIGVARFTNGTWGPKTKIDALSSGEFTSTDPWVSADESEMFFWSDRPAAFAGPNIYRSVRVDGAWQQPELLPAPINSDGDDMMTFLFDGWLYFGSGRDGEPYSIYRSERLGPMSFGPPEVFVRSAFAVGEPSFTADGRTLYFEQIFTDGTNYNPDVMRVSRVDAP